MKMRVLLICVILCITSILGCSKPHISVNEDYQGPIFPLSFVTETEGIVAEREITVDYRNYQYPVSTNEAGNRKVWTNDRYILTNITDQDIVAEYAYGFVGDYSTALSMLPLIRVDGLFTDSELVFGRSPLRYGAELSNREGYEQLLKRGNYRDEAFDSATNGPVLSEEAHVYKFKRVEDVPVNRDGQSLYRKVSFVYDSATTEVYCHGFTECKTQNGSIMLGGSVSEKSDDYIIAVGDNLEIESIKFYEYSNSRKEVEDFSEEVEEYTCSFDEVLEEVVIEKKDIVKVLTWGENYVYSELETDQILQVGKQHIVDMRELNMETKYPVRDLEGYMFNMYGDSRVSYQTAQITIPANSSVELSFEYDKYTGIERIEGKAYDGLEIMTVLGSNIEFESQTLKIVGLDQSLISEYTTSEEIKNGQCEIAMTEDFYSIYLDVME